ncbi:MAG: DUF805 domain-containing protein [Elusimicrobiota bacterium]|jgi:uncharacterized membrane protein YhaH (DUF805 family)|nr:DUF805 domain-containing protein [Elusimicrobiota bacterium]
MNFFKHYFLDIVSNHYVDFKGCTPRKEFWFYTLWATVIFLFFDILGSLALLPVIAFIINMTVSLALLLPSLAIAARRLHDIDFRGYWLLLSVVPFAFYFVFTIAFILASFGELKMPINNTTPYVFYLYLSSMITFCISALGSIVLIILFCLKTKPNRWSSPQTKFLDEGSN